MLTRYYEPILSTAFDLFPDYVLSSSGKQSDTIDKNGIKVELPGVKSSDLEVTVTGKHLHINGKNRHGKVFNYAYSISNNVNVDKICAKFFDGLL
jgi:HSP20 family molecular chaperone IbpA